MAYEARLSDYSKGGVLGQTLQEGLPVVISSIESTSHPDLPVLIAAGTNQVNNIGILLKGPDDFPRPTDSRMYTANYLMQIDPSSGYSDPVNTTTMYSVGKSTLWNPTLVSGELALMKRGGTYAVPSGTFNDSATIRAKGTLIRVNGGKWDYTATESQSVGIVEEYNTTNSVLIFTLWH